MFSFFNCSNALFTVSSFEPNNITFWGMNNIPTVVSIILGIVIFFAGWFIMYMMLNLTDSIQAMQLRKYYVRKYGVIVEDLIDE